jgi:hypothetical protein
VIAMTSADPDPRRARVHAPKKPTHEKDQGFNESHGWAPGHGGPTGPGDEPATEDATESQPSTEPGHEDESHDTSRRPRSDSHPDSRT